MFKDRQDAGRQLAEKLSQYRGTDAIVLALPRGGVVTGHEIARALKLPLDIVVTRKIGHPGNPEYALCAVDETGAVICNETEVKTVDQGWLKKETERQRAEAQWRSATYREDRAPLNLAGRVIIMVDDGIATGLTMQLAIAVVKAQKPEKIVVATPVAPSDAVESIRRQVDECLVLEPPEEFMGAVGAHYETFEQVEDEEVVTLLQSAYEARSTLKS